MPFSPKPWKNGSIGGTKLNDAGLIDVETRLSGYTDEQVGLLSILPDAFGVNGGEADETNAWNSLIAAVSAAGGGLITVPALTYRVCNVKLKSGVQMRFQPGAVFKFALVAAEAAAAPSIFDLATPDPEDTTFIEGVRFYGELFIDGSDLHGPGGDRTEVPGNPRGVFLANVRDFYIEAVRASNLPGNAGNAILAEARKGGVDTVATRGRIGTVVHENSPFVGNSAIQLGGCRDIIVDRAFCDYGTGFRVEIHKSGGGAVQGHCENVQCLEAVSETPGNGPAKISAGNHATGTITTVSAHGFKVGDSIQFRALKKSGEGEVGLLVETTYFVVSVGSPTTFQVSETAGGGVKTWAVDLTGGYARYPCRAVTITAHDKCLIRGVKVHEARARNGADGLQTSHEPEATIRDCRVGGIDVQGGGKATLTFPGHQYDFSGMTVGPGRVIGSVSEGGNVLQRALMLDLWAELCAGPGWIDVASTEIEDTRAYIRGGGGIDNGGYGYELDSTEIVEVSGAETKDPPPKVNANLLSGEEKEQLVNKEAWAKGSGCSALASVAEHLAPTFTHSMEATASAATCQIHGREKAIVIEPGKVVLTKGFCLAQTAARQARFNVRFFNAEGTQIGADAVTLNTALKVGEQVEISGYVTAPATSATMMLLPTVAGATAGEKFNWTIATFAGTVGARQPTQSFGISVGAGVTVRVIGGDHSRNSVGESTGGGVLKRATFA